ncbi:MAG TPA: carboxylesterase family protein, partial [Solirubrobacteraceae bacterium]|nr:carboxylesterase family protein [Solirubrobacteraceae bacterium]
MKVPRIRARWIGPLAALAALAAVAVLVASAGVGARPARADTTATPACTPGTNVTINSGPICGLTVNGTNEWFGIPYAAPPVGSLRWEPPQPPTPWTTTLQATQFGSECTQGATSPPSGSENCLFVNVWAPADGSTGNPVLVHIHGGGFVGGSGNGDNSLLSSTGHEVVVSLNYRLGIFGFLADKDLGPNSGDYGLQD